MSIKQTIQTTLTEMTSGKLSNYVVKAKDDYVSKIDTDRSGSIKRARSVELARRKIINKSWNQAADNQQKLNF